MIVETVTLSLRDGSAEISGRSEASLLRAAEAATRQIEAAAGIYRLKVRGLKLPDIVLDRVVGFEVHFIVTEENVVESVEVVYEWLRVAARCAGKWIEPDLKILVLAFNCAKKQQATIYVGTFDEAQAVARDIAEGKLPK